MLYLAVTPFAVWVVILLACLAVLVLRRPQGSFIHTAALLLAIIQCVIAFMALGFTQRDSIGGGACLTGFTGTRLLIVVLLAELGTLVTFLLVDRQTTLALLRREPAFTGAFAALQFLTLAATFRSALLCTV